MQLLTIIKVFNHNDSLNYELSQRDISVVFWPQTGSFLSHNQTLALL